MSGEYFQQAIFGRRDIVGLHYGQKHERVSSFCRSLHEDSKQNPDGVKVSIRWDDKRGQWIVASSSARASRTSDSLTIPMRVR